MSEKWFDGTSAYKISEYYDYTANSEKKEEEREKQQRKRIVVNYKKLVSVLTLVFIIGISYLYANALLIQTASEHDRLTDKLEDMQVRNTQLAFDIESGIDLALVEEKAITEYGMQQPEGYQNVYVDVVQSDYTETYNATADTGIIASVIDGLKAFLMYIG